MRNEPISLDKDREAFFRALFDHSPAAMVVLDAHGLIQCTNQAAMALFAEGCPDYATETWEIDALDGTCTLHPSGRQTHFALTCDVSEINWQGERHTLAVVAAPKENSSKGEFTAAGSQSITNNIPYEQVFDHAQVGFVLTRVVHNSTGEPVDFEFVNLNRTLEEALNLDRRRIIGLSVLKVFTQIKEKGVWDALATVARSGQAARVQVYSEAFEKSFKLSLYAPVAGYVAAIFTDITQQVEIESELQHNEAKLQSFFDAMALGVVIQDRNGKITSANPAAERILGFEHDTLIGMGSLNYDWQTVKLNGEPLPGEKHPAMVSLRTGRRVDDFILGLIHPQTDARKWLSVSAVPEFNPDDEDPIQVITTFMDVTDRIRVQRAFEERVKELRCLTNISGLLQKSPSLEMVCEFTVWELVSAMQYPEFAFAEIRLAGKSASSNKGAAVEITALVEPIFSDDQEIGEIRVCYSKDLPFALPEEKDLLESVADSLALWYERSMMRRHLQDSEARFRQAVMNMPAPIMIHAEDGEVITLNEAWVQISGYSQAEIPTLSHWLAEAYGEHSGRVRALIDKLFSLDGPLDEGEFTIRTRDGSSRVWDFRSTPLGTLPDGRKAVISMAIDVTQRRQVEGERERYYARIRALRQIDQVIGSTLDMDEVLARITRELSRVMQYDSMSVMLIDNGMLEIIAGQGFQIPEEVIGLRFPNEPDYPNYEVIEAMRPVTSTQISRDYPNFTQPLRHDLSINIKAWLGVPLISQDGVIGMFAIDRLERIAFTEEDIQIAMEFANRAAIALHNAQLYQRTQEQLEKLSVLRNIDSVITNSLDLDEALPVLLRQIKAGLGVDAAAIMLFDPSKNELVLQAWNGLKHQPQHDLTIPLGQGYTGKAAQDQEPVFVAEADYLDDGWAYPVDLRSEGMVAFYGLPMIAKGKLQGVLELFHRSPLSLDENWQAFAETLARQAAIAVDDISLFTALEQANEDLKRAYDATIQGWAKALELRDQETEGHSQRVVALTQAVAARFGFEGKALRDIRRGVLLHDIGKMAIPDEILKKPGPLTEAEWDVMRQHPTNAYDMLRDIEYLEQALRIPHYHHERWDGSGYPDGLSGEAIPLEARIFAVVDVWDALNSDRPYRNAWPRADVIQYLQKQSGKEFDPGVVEVFFEIIEAAGS